MENDLLGEPLDENARWARELAADLCEADGDGACAWYHAAYPTLRLLGLVATPERHAAFYERTLGARVGAPDCRRVLVSGAADTAMLALVLRAARARPAACAPQVSVVDRCRTPVSLCERYGARAGLDVEGRVLDLFAPAAREAPAAPYDLVCTHSLLALVPPGRRGDLVAAWRAQLRPGGVVVSTARLDPGGASASAAPTDADAFAERALAAARASATPLGVEPAALAALARGYAARLASWPLATADALAAVLDAGGFALEELCCVEVAGALGRGTAAGTHRSAAYAEFVAVRR